MGCKPSHRGLRQEHEGYATAPSSWQALEKLFFHGCSWRSMGESAPPSWGVGERAGWLVEARGLEHHRAHSHCCSPQHQGADTVLPRERHAQVSLGTEAQSWSPQHGSARKGQSQDHSPGLADS